MFTRRLFLTSSALALVSAPLWAADLPLGPVFAKGGVAIRGADPVAYFTEGAARYGEKSISYDWQGVTWRFVSEDNRAAFQADPAAYAPQYGGNCAWAVSQGYTASTTPEAWRIVDGKLYLNYSKGVQRTWEKDIPTNITNADKNWPGLATKS